MRISESGVDFMTRLTVWATNQPGVITEKLAREFVETYTDEDRIRVLTSLVLDATAGLKPPTVRPS